MSSKRRNWKSLSADEKQRLLTIKSTDLLSLCEEWGVSYTAAILARSKRYQPVLAGKAPILRDWKSLSGDSLILSDLHMPKHDSSFLNQVLDVAVAWDLSQLVLAGDVYDMDALSVFDKERAEPTTEEELKEGSEILCRLARRFDRILWIAGNHDTRLVKRAIKALGISGERAWGMMQAVDKIEISPYHHCRLLSGSGPTWLIEHPKNASQTPGAVGEKLAAKFLCNIVVAHGHTVGVRRDRSGRFTIIDSGGGFHLDKLEYVSLEHGTRPAMNQGAVLIAGGVGYLLDPLNCDWDLLHWMGRHQVNRKVTNAR